MEKVAIVAAKRTPIGGFLGQFQSLKAPDLGGVAIQAALEQAGVASDQVEEVFMGNVLSAGIGQAPARQAALKAGLPNSVPCTTLNKVCGSGMKAVMLGANAIRVGEASIVVAGGMESMSNAPYLLPTARQGMRMGNQPTVDSMVNDGLWDPYDDMHMGMCGELCADKYNFTREAQDEFTLESLKRAREAVQAGTFSQEIAPVTVASRKGETVYDQDEQPSLAKPEKIPSLRSVFKKDGTITAANASSINDGAAALVLASEAKVQELGLTPLAWLTDQTSFAHEPKWFTTAPVTSMKKLLERQSLSASEVDLWEINEAFAVVTMAALHDLELDHAKVNVNGGATALGHPIGCTGARIMVTLLYALKQQQKQKGIASLCIGGGEATSVLLENV